MPTTPRYAIPYPASSDSPNGPTQMNALASRVETVLGVVDDTVTANAVAKSAAFYATSPVSIPAATDTKIAFPTTDRSSAYITPSLAGNQNFTVNQSGIYDIAFSGRGDVAAGSTWLCFLSLSSSSAGANRIIVGAGGGAQFPAFCFSGTAPLVSGTAYSVYLYNDNGGAKFTNPEGKAFRVSFTYLGS